MSEAKSPNDETLTIRDHLDPDKHWIGETLPAGSLKDMSAQIGATTAVGVSPFPARIDHTHKVDMTSLGGYVLKAGDTMTGSLWVPALYVYNASPGLSLYAANGTTRHGYFYYNSGSSTFYWGVETGGQLAFDTGGFTRETIDVSGNHWWVGAYNGDAMVFDRSNQQLVIKAAGVNEVLRLSGNASTPYIGFHNVDFGARMGYVQGTASAMIYGVDTGTHHRFYIGGVEVFNISAGQITHNSGKVWLTYTPGSGTWTEASYVAYNSNTYGESRICLYSNPVAPQLRSVAASGERLEVVNWNSGLYASIAASAFTVSSSIKIKKDVRDIRCRALDVLRRNKTELNPLSDTVPELDIMSLRPIAFRYKDAPVRLESVNPDKEIDPKDITTWKAVPRDPKSHLGIDGYREKLGLIGEEVQKVLPCAVAINENADIIGIDYAQVTVALLSHVQQLTEEVVSLRERVAELENV